MTVRFTPVHGVPDNGVFIHTVDIQVILPVRRPGNRELRLLNKERVPFIAPSEKQDESRDKDRITCCSIEYTLHSKNYPPIGFLMRVSAGQIMKSSPRAGDFLLFPRRALLII